MSALKSPSQSIGSRHVDLHRGVGLMTPKCHWAMLPKECYLVSICHFRPYTLRTKGATKNISSAL